MYAIGVSYRTIPVALAGLNPVVDLKTILSLRTVIRQDKPDKVLAYTAKPAIYAHLAARFAGGPQIYGMITGLGYGLGRLSLFQKAVGAVMCGLYRLALRRSAGVFFQSPGDEAEFRMRTKPGQSMGRTWLKGWKKFG